jgi:hypothetical protein
MEETVKEWKIKNPTGRDPEQTAAKAWHVLYYLTYAVVDRTGTVRAIGLQPQYVEKVVEQVLAEGEDKK